MNIDWIYLSDISTKLILSGLLAGLIGYEREVHGRAAGLRTHILVSVGSCLIMLTSEFVFVAYQGLANCDPARIAAGVVTGIGFLGAGTILRYRVSVIGLTTAASIWAVAAIGLSVGTGFYAGAIITTFLIMATLIFITRFEANIIRKDWYRTLVIEAHGDAKRIHKMRNVLTKHRVEIRDLEIEKIPDKAELKLLFDIKLTSNKYDDSIIIDLLKIDGILKAQWDQ